MARKKEYIENEVIEKAMSLFWRNGYENTSVRMLEKEMGINQFSIYSSFGSKQGVFLESIKCYRKKLSTITDKLRDSNNGITGLKQYFYDFIDFAKATDFGKGCLITNAANELGESPEPMLQEVLMKFTEDIKELFAINLKQEANRDSKLIKQQANYLLVSMIGLSTATKLFDKKLLSDYIETTFKNL